MEIAVAIISGLLTLFGTVLTIKAGNKKTDENIRIAQAVTDTKIEELTREVREHNGFARRLPVVENELKHMKERLDKMEEAE